MAETFRGPPPFRPCADRVTRRACKFDGAQTSLLMAVGRLHGPAEGERASDGLRCGQGTRMPARACDPVVYDGREPCVRPCLSAAADQPAEPPRPTSEEQHP
ncbi:hypothetical protein GCM10010420_50640 [Streptomyces glaucosporus]|uniref:Uncharacterized protein n=1 Tax=Streptomyces glaucosporus TaxID=284044 RepID=A0ABN3IUW8_9ACTN